MKHVNDAEARTLYGGNWKCSVCGANFSGGLIGYMLCHNHCGKEHCDLWFEGKSAQPEFRW